MDDSISRKEIHDWVERYCEEEYMHPGYIREEHILKKIETMPSAEPEIIRCKDCRDYTDDYCRRFGDDYGTDFYCGFAERRTDG